ncbi:MAG: hypothetical protein U5L96_17200 [Owenweeksia sp.]|nr:hypothetical protein [Owenweeksia sp.]
MLLILELNHANYVLNQNLDQAVDNMNLSENDYADRSYFEPGQLEKLNIMPGDNIYKVDNNHPRSMIKPGVTKRTDGAVAVSGVSNAEVGHFLGLDDRYIAFASYVEQGF